MSSVDWLYETGGSDGGGNARPGIAYPKPGRNGEAPGIIKGG